MQWSLEKELQQLFVHNSNTPQARAQVQSPANVKSSQDNK